MGWIAISDSAKVSDGLWNGQGVAYFSISDEVLAIHNAVFSYLATITPMTYGILFLLLVFIIVSSIFISIRLWVNKHV